MGTWGGSCGGDGGLELSHDGDEGHPDEKDGRTGSEQKLQEETITLEQQIQMAQEQLRIYEPNISNASAEELESCEKALLKTMNRLIQRKMQMDRMGQIISEGGEEMPSSSFFEGLSDYDQREKW
ncbi:hypothetical protein RHGRI_021334 [Rhododendron griersonianum]|uniref:Uncharacterized protein n=1 Tax=Rhododendron griersonianum TaxID=479676 RepID=A0AAV6JQS1_9ERIC|nr:hypothetical protein RHGRI_021334 [Rhododendron griersonianum]